MWCQSDYPNYRRKVNKPGLYGHFGGLGSRNKKQKNTSFRKETTKIWDVVNLYILRSQA